MGARYRGINQAYNLNLHRWGGPLAFDSSANRSDMRKDVLLLGNAPYEAAMQRLNAIFAWLRQRPKTSLAIAIVAVLISFHVGPLLITHPTQDACSFGTVSNERYRELLVEAKRRQVTTWPPLAWDNKKSMMLLNQRVDDLSRGTTSAYERLAAMHAVMRALGGDYRSTEDDREDPFENKNRLGIIGYHYHVDLNGLGFFSPIWHRMWVIGDLVFNPDAAREVIQDRSRAQPGNIDFIVWYPSVFDSYITIPRSNRGECPRLPDAALAERLSQSR